MAIISNFFYEENLSDSEKGLQFELVWLPSKKKTEVVYYYRSLKQINNKSFSLVCGKGAWKRV